MATSATISAANVKVLGHEEMIRFGFTHRIKLTHADLTDTTDTSVLTLALLSLKIGQIVRECCVDVVTAFSGGDCTAVGLEVGDDGDPNRYLVSLDIMGTTYQKLQPVGTTTSPFVYTAANTVDAVITPSTGDLDSLTAGEAYIYLKVTPPITDLR